MHAFVAKAKLKLIHYLQPQQNGKPLFYILKFLHKITNVSRRCIHQSHGSNFALNYGKLPSLANHIRVFFPSILLTLKLVVTKHNSLRVFYYFKPCLILLQVLMNTGAPVWNGKRSTLKPLTFKLRHTCWWMRSTERYPRRRCSFTSALPSTLSILFLLQSWKMFVPPRTARTASCHTLRLPWQPIPAEALFKQHSK